MSGDPTNLNEASIDEHLDFPRTRRSVRHAIPGLEIGHASCRTTANRYVGRVIRNRIKLTVTVWKLTKIYAINLYVVSDKIPWTPVLPPSAPAVGRIKDAIIPLEVSKLSHIFNQFCV